jgi:Ni/Fe-hydrogenase subunit HybB-like protein
MTTLTRNWHRLPRPSAFQLWLALLALLMLAGLGAGWTVYAQGLVVTNLTDLVPWGLWITIDLSSIAMSAGAFSLSAAVYLLGFKRLAPLARTATFIGLIGYSMAVLCLMLDIGRPERFWHALVFWNPHSVLWEVTMCVTLYFGVLVIETLPIFAEWAWLKRHWPRVSARLVGLHRLAPMLALAGLGLSMLHQSSLGATYGILKARPIWNRPDLSVLFILSALAAGPALTVLATLIVGRLRPQAQLQADLVQKVAQFLGWAMVVYLYFRFWDAFAMTYTYVPGRTEGLSLITQGPFAFNFWVGEILLGAVVPIFLLQTPRLRRIPWVLAVAMALIVGGVVAYRWDTNLVGQVVLLSYLPADLSARYTDYVPSLVEFLAGAGIVAYGLLAFSLAARYLNVVDPTPSHEPALEVQPLIQRLLAKPG